MSLIILLPLALSQYLAVGHGMFADPPSRSLNSGVDNRYTPQAGNSAGVLQRISDQSDVPFPDDHHAEGTHGLCGDPWEGGDNKLLSLDQQPFMKEGNVRTTYKTGSQIEITIDLTAHHMGQFYFSICDGGLTGERFSKQIDGQDCLNAHRLHRVDPATRKECQNVTSLDKSNYDCQVPDAAHPERWYLPPPSYAEMVQGRMRYKMLFQLPQGLTCEKCTMQWWWLTANSCNAGGVVEYFRTLEAQYGDLDEGWLTASLSTCSRDTMGEQFWNCADVELK